MFDLRKLSEDVDLTEVLEQSLENVKAIHRGEGFGDPVNLDARSVHIPINPPPAVDYAAELAEAIAQCQSAAARAAGLLERMKRGGS